MSQQSEEKQIRYAVVGLGYIAQVAVLPAFAHAKSNSVLQALVSDDPIKLKKLGEKYGVSMLYSYDQYRECLESGEIDAVYIALPNSMHADFSILAANHGVHVLCEKPLAATVDECERMISATEDHDVKLMTAYRLHFEEANLEAIEIIKSGKIGEPRMFNSTFSMQVKDGNIRLRRDLGGGPLLDLGIYCLNAARYILGSEPLEVTTLVGNIGEKRFSRVEEAVAALMRFPNDCLATFMCSFGAADASFYQIIGTEGVLRVEPAFEYQDSLVHHLTKDGKTKKRAFQKRDQFAAELIYFSECIQKNRTPEPSGLEGLADVRIINAIYESAYTGEAVAIEPLVKRLRPTKKQEIHRPPVRFEPQLVHAESPGIS